MKRGVLRRSFGFLGEIGRRFNPWAYEELSEYKLKHSLAFLAKLLAAAIVLEFVLFIPTLARLPGAVDAALDKFTVLELKPNISTAEPVTIKFGKNEFIVDSSENASVPERGILVTPHKIVSSSWFGVEEHNLTGLSSVLVNRERYKNALWVFLALVLPGIIVLTYIFRLLYYAILSGLLAFIALIIVRLIRFEIDYKSIINMTFAAFTAVIVVHALTEPFMILLPQLLWAVVASYGLTFFYLIVGIRRVGYFEKERRFVRRKPGYIGI